MGLLSHEDEKGILFSKVLVCLYRGVLYRENAEELWEGLLEMQARVRDHFAVVGLQLMIDEAEGYAFMRYPHEVEDAPEQEVPRLVARRALSFPVSLMLALLRKRLTEFDAGGDSTRLVMTRDDIAEMMRVFMPDGSNDAKIIDKIDAHINKVKELGFIRSLKDQTNTYEVLRIIKAFIDAQCLLEFEKNLESYRKQIQRDEDE